MFLLGSSMGCAFQCLVSAFLGVSEGDTGNLQEAAPERAVCWDTWFPNTGYRLFQVPSFYLFWATLLRTREGFPRKLERSTEKSKRNEHKVDPPQCLWFDFLVEVLLWYQMEVISSDKSFRERALLPKLNTSCLLLSEYPFHTYACLAGLYIGDLRRWDSCGDTFEGQSISIPSSGF